MRPSIAGSHRCRVSTSGADARVRSVGGIRTVRTGRTPDARLRDDDLHQGRPAGRLGCDHRRRGQPCRDVRLACSAASSSPEAGTSTSGPGEGDTEVVHVYGDVLQADPGVVLQLTEHPGPIYRENHAELTSRMTWRLEQAGVGLTRLTFTNDEWSEGHPAQAETAETLAARAVELQVVDRDGRGHPDDVLTTAAAARMPRRAVGTTRSSFRGCTTGRFASSHAPSGGPSRADAACSPREWAMRSSVASPARG